MPTETDLNLIRDLIDKIEIFIGRPQVQQQLVAIVIITIIAEVANKALWLTIGNRIYKLLSKRLPFRVQPFLHLAFSLLQGITFPVLALVLLGQVRGILQEQGLLDGLIVKVAWLFWFLIIFQVLVTLLYAAFETRDVRRYYYRLLIPLLIMIVILQILDNLVSLENLAELPLVTVFDSPITLGALFIATFGLYFWTDTIQAIIDFIYAAIVRFSRIDAGSAKAALTLARYALVILGISFAISQLQLNATTVAAITGGLSVGVGFGLREILSNFISGILLLFERSLQPGDIIEVENELSIVERLSIRATTVRTLNNVELVIPNQTFFTSSFKTFTGTDKHVRVPLVLSTDCQIEPGEVAKLLIKTALSHEVVLAVPEPTVFLLEYGNNVATFQLNLWVDDPLCIPEVTSEVKMDVWHALVDHGVALPFPEIELHFPERMMGLPLKVKVDEEE